MYVTAVGRLSMRSLVYWVVCAVGWGVLAGGGARVQDPLAIAILLVQKQTYEAAKTGDRR